MVAALGTIFFGLFFYLFPNGRFVPNWTRWLALIWIAILMPGVLFPGSLLDTNHWPPALVGILLSGFILTFILAQDHRYKHYSNWTERQQTKWVVFGLATVRARVFPRWGGWLIAAGQPVFLFGIVAYPFAIIGGSALGLGLVLCGRAMVITGPYPSLKMLFKT